MSAFLAKAMFSWISAATILSNSAGVVGDGSVPSACSRSLTSGDSSAFRTSALRRLMIAGGAPAGANSPTQKL